MEWTNIFLALSLLRKVKAAVPEREVHATLLREFEERLPEAATKLWRKQLNAWEGDRSKLNPFKPQRKGELIPLHTSMYF